MLTGRIREDMCMVQDPYQRNLPQLFLFLFLCGGRRREKGSEFTRLSLRHYILACGETKMAATVGMLLAVNVLRNSDWLKSFVD